MRHIDGDGFCIASLEPSPLETPLYSTALSHAKSIVFSRVPMFPSGHGVRERPLGALPDITNIRKKRTAAFDIGSSVSFNLGLLPRLIPCHLPTASILYRDCRGLLLRIGAV
jgi:hypothetical protein